MAQRRVVVRSGRDLGIALAEARLARGLTQEAVAADAGIARTYLARMENGLSVQLLDRALRVLRRLGAEVTVSLPSRQDPANESSRHDGP
jgi:HTH-type transcriptional regulator/antitoxin HipB